MQDLARIQTPLTRYASAVLAALATLLAAALLPASAAAVDYAANPGSLGAIPDGTGSPPSPGPPRDVTFDVVDQPGGITDVAVEMTFNPAHTWGGDIVATLIAPDGATSHLLFGRTGAATAPSFGDSSDLAGPYRFSDGAPASPTWWESAAATAGPDPIPAGSYRASESGGDGSTGAATLITPTFSGLDGADGTWILRLVDVSNIDTGSISAATLSVTTDETPPETTITDGPGPGATLPGRETSFSFSSSEPGSSFECKLDAQPFAACTSPQQYVDLGDGSHTFSVRASDQFGNTDATPATRSFSVDACARAQQALAAAKAALAKATKAAKKAKKKVKKSSGKKRKKAKKKLKKAKKKQRQAKAAVASAEAAIGPACD